MILILPSWFINQQEKGTVRMPTWQVEDITELNGDIDSSLSLGSDLANNSYNVSDAILSISGLTVFKQEAPSPTNNDVSQLQLVRQNRQSPTSTQQVVHNGAIEETNNQNMINNTINQLLTQSAYTNLQNAIDANLVSSPNSQDNYNVTSTNYSFAEDCRFQYVLAAATSIATKVNEDTLTYLNQGQSYEIKLKKLGDLSMYRGKLLKSVIRMCFHERRLQYMEKEQMAAWQRARPGDRILEVDVPLSYGAFDIVQPTNALNIIHFNWDPTKEVGVYIKVNCISTEFTPKKHGGEKGVPFRIQVETYQNGDNLDSSVRLHAAACQIKVFKLKGADRKHKQDREKIMKRPLSEQEKYQPSYECTVLNDIPNDAVLNSPPIAPISAAESGSNHGLSKKEPSVESAHLKTNNAGAGPPQDKVDRKITEANVISNDHLSSHSTPEETTAWLVNNRFDKYLETFANFSGADMLRMSRDDLIQICGQADGIRFYNAIHLKTIAPKLKIYVCRQNTSIFNAVFLSSHSNVELLEKLSELMGVSQDQVRDIYMEGPHSIHVQLNNDVIRHIKEETMFSVEILQENGNFVFLLKRTVK
ncbi:transcription factor CP2-like protein 1 isoform X2 [Tribolium castaneum]|uniref:transcription factor CP2-like protein 1 isoform X2 n=1 Tax=Tribolium castaneum TaxID=7070 RepID=UPI00077DE657|nr:PREDICTED: transcription factor CP2-like protein 1 isoform X2 [Tribolium castaneum]|eukprot:XP_015837103.1 PREDICTED: transcription factor CP2-like protein 1 isoform X2 [Tribolium castaneum]